MSFTRLAKAVCLLRVGVIIAASMGSSLPAGALAQDSVEKFGHENPAAPEELRMFSFLIGEWETTAHAPNGDGTFGDVKIKWVGRYILDGMAIADEIHAVVPDGTTYLGITLRHFDPAASAWVVDFLNVTNSFVRQQVNRRSGSVIREGDTIVVTDPDGDKVVREEYRLIGRDRFVYSLLMSDDGGETWGARAYEYDMKRVK